jgi:hypothetical protein
MDPPSVEGWHTGQEWIDSGALVRRINFVAERVGDVKMEGVQSVIDRLGAQDGLSAQEMLDSCLYLMGAIRLEEDTRKELVSHIEAGGPIKRGSSEEDRIAFAQRVTEALQLVASSREYQFG